MQYLDRNTGVSVAVAERRRLAFNLRRQGLEYAEIADQIQREIPPDLLPDNGYSSWWAHNDVTWVIDRMRQEVSETAADVIALENSRLDVMLASLWPSVLRGNARSIEVALRVMERRSKMLGLDEASKKDWRIEIGSMIVAGIITREEAQQELGDELWSLVARYLGDQDTIDLGPEQMLTTNMRNTSSLGAKQILNDPMYNVKQQLGLEAVADD